MMLQQEDLTRPSLQAIGDDAPDAPPSRLTWLVIGMAVMLFAKPLIGLGEGVLGLGHAGIGRARKRIDS